MPERGARLVLCVCLGLALVGVPARAEDAGVSEDLRRYREAHHALAAGEYARARGLFEQVPAGSILADYAAFFAAESLLRAGDETAALARFRAVAERFPDSTLAAPAVLAAHDTAFRLGEWAEAEREARRFLGRWPGHPEAGRVLVRLAEARAAQGLVAEAVLDLRRRWIEAPTSGWGEAAREVMEELARAHGLPLPPLTPDEQLRYAQRLAEGGDLAGASQVLEGLLAERPAAELRDRALLRLGPILARLGRVAEGIAWLEGAVREAPTPGRAGLLLELARLLRRAGQAAAAVPVLERLLAEHPEAEEAPEGWLALGRVQLELGAAEAAREAFRRLRAAAPESPAAAAAGWELAWLDYRARRFRSAALAFRELAATVPAFRLAGLYWSARALEALRERAAAAALYREVLRRAPEGYYGLLAARRVAGPRPMPAHAAVRLPADPIARLETEPRFLKGRALWRLGFEGHALGELEALGREALAEPERAWGLAVTFAQIGEPGRSLRYLRRAFGAAAEAGAPGLPARFWRLFYPLGYAELVREAARRVGLDPFFVAAVIREESSYDPRARSGAGAIGLMQLMPETAQVVGPSAGLGPVDPAGLWEPPVNIALGAHYLAQLRARFREPLLAAAGYNAGPHRVQRWLAERSRADLEEFVELIPFDETRAFVKRVFTSWHHYRRLYAAPERVPRRGEAEATPRAGR